MSDADEDTDDSEDRVRTPRRLTTILAADLCDYAGMTEADPRRALGAVEAATARIDAIARARGGRLFHRAGDGFLAELPSASAGVAAARSIQDDPQDADGHPLCLRVGVHTGEVTEEASGDLLGHAVNVAARLQGEAPKGGTVISGATRALSETGAPLRRMGELKLKGMREPVLAYEVLTRGPMISELAGFFRFRWLWRNRRPALVVGLTVVIAGALVTGALVRRDLDLAEQRVAAADAVRLRDDASALADLLTQEEARLLDREAVEQAALSLLGSTDEARAEARRLALAGDPVGAARALRVVYEAQVLTAAPPEMLAEIAVQCGALAYRRDQTLAKWAYERAYDAVPAEPLILLRLAALHVDQGEYDDARSYISALRITEPGIDYDLRAEQLYAYVLQLEKGYDEAEMRLKNSLARARAANRFLDEADVLSQLSLLYLELAAGSTGEARLVYERDAEQSSERSLRVYRALGNLDGVSNILGNLSQLALMRGDLEVSVELQLERLVLLQDRGDYVTELSTRVNLASLFHKLADYDGRNEQMAAVSSLIEQTNTDSVRGYVKAVEAAFLHDDGRASEACDVISSLSNERPSSVTYVNMFQTMSPNAECF